MKTIENFKVNINTPDPGYEPFPVSIMNRSTHEALTFDPTLGKPATISYRLNKAGCIRVRIVLRNIPGLILRTLKDWGWQDFGKYELKWDGCDRSGNIIDNKRVLVLFEAKDQGKGLRHESHDEKICCDPTISIRTRPEPGVTVKGALEVYSSFLGLSRGLMEKSGCEVRYYIDYSHIKTEIFKSLPDEFCLKVDTASLVRGKHLITVNVDDLHDHIGSAGVEISV